MFSITTESIKYLLYLSEEKIDISLYLLTALALRSIDKSELAPITDSHTL